MATVIRTERVTVRFGNLVALSDVDLSLKKGELLGLIGPNGAGKTTIVNVISGFQRLSEGKIWLGDDDVTATKAEVLVRRGVTRTFQGARVFGQLSVLENVEAGAVGCGKSRRVARKEARALVDRVGFSALGSSSAVNLSHGQRRVVGLLRALATQPDLLLLDEPAAGLDEDESRDLVGAIRWVRDEFGCGVMVIEHDMGVIMPLCERIHVLNYGRTIAEGAPAEVAANPAVIDAYIGDELE